MDRLNKFMEDRNGIDQLTLVLALLIIAFALISTFTKNFVLSLITVFVLVICWARVFSKNLERRQLENKIVVMWARKLRKNISKKTTNLKHKIQSHEIDSVKTVSWLNKILTNLKVVFNKVTKKIVSLIKKAIKKSKKVIAYLMSIRQYKYFHCEHCHQQLKVDRHQHLNEISCPKCHNKIKIKA